MYDQPGGGTFSSIFLIIAKSVDGKTSIPRWFYVNPEVGGEVAEILKPQFRTPLFFPTKVRSKIWTSNVPRTPIDPRRQELDGVAPKSACRARSALAAITAVFLILAAWELGYVDSVAIALRVLLLASIIRPPDALST